MKRIIYLKGKISSYLKKGQLIKGAEFLRFEKPFLEKARKNFVLANVLMKISEKEEAKKSLSLPSDFEVYDWVIIASYYSMYISALGALARLGLKSKSHAATLAVLEYNYVHQQKGLEIKHLEKLSKAYAISQELVTKLIKTKTRRETAQYDATPAISMESAVFALKDVEEFITKIEEILSVS